MSVKRKFIVGVASMLIACSSGLAPVLAADSTTPNADVLYKQEKMQKVTDLDSLFNKKSFKPTDQDSKKNQELKNSIVPESELGPKGNSDKMPVAPKGWKGGDSFGNPTGTNNISFASFDYGDMIDVHDGTVAWGYYRHTGIWDTDYYTGSLYDLCIWEANVVPTKDVHRNTPDFFRHYDEAVGLWVPSTTSSQRYDTTSYIAAQAGDLYLAGSDIWNETSWYCSKLAWRSYYFAANLDLRYSSLATVYPDDLYHNSNTYIFANGY